VQTPDGSRTLTKDLSLALKPGTGVLVMGESGAGKSSLLRTIAGLWGSGSGAIERPTLNRMIFLPQRPYMVQGSLREQLVYPQHENAADDDAVKAALESVNLEEVLERVDGDLGKEVDWTNVLSLGEQQRVSFARLAAEKAHDRVPRRGDQRSRRAERAAALRAPARARHRLRERRPPEHAEAVPRLPAHAAHRRVVGARSRSSRRGDAPAKRQKKSG
jgi:hypothetical protein